MNMGLPSKDPASQHRRHEIRVRSLGQEDALEKGMATHSSIPAMDRGTCRATVHRVAKRQR